MAPSTYSGLTTSLDWICGNCGSPRSADRCGAFARRRRNFVGMMRIKNEARRIAEVIESILPLCEKVFILDDHSGDETIAICRRFPQVAVFPSPFSGLNESRDKNWLYDQIIAECQPDWILCIDGDEVLERRGPGIIRETVAADPARNAFALQIAYIWDTEQTVRTDRIYGDFWRPSLFRPYVEDPDVPDTRTMLAEFRFMATPFGRQRGNDQPNLHCSSVPQRFIHGRGLCPARLKHYGYLDREDRIGKLDYYTSIDWLNAAEDCYRHMCQGDGATLDELPRIRGLIADGLITLADAQSLTNVAPEARLVHAGPLKIEPWDEDAPWPVSEWARQEHRPR